MLVLLKSNSGLTMRRIRHIMAAVHCISSIIRKLQDSNYKKFFAQNRIVTEEFALMNCTEIIWISFQENGTSKSISTEDPPETFELK